MMQKLTYAFTYVSCVRANTDLEEENHGSGTGLFLIGRSTYTGCWRSVLRWGKVFELSLTVHDTDRKVKRSDKFI